LSEAVERTIKNVVARKDAKAQSGINLTTISKLE
jgi:hypothetical protein